MPLRYLHVKYLLLVALMLAVMSASSQAIAQQPPEIKKSGGQTEKGEKENRKGNNVQSLGNPPSAVAPSTVLPHIDAGIHNSSGNNKSNNPAQQQPKSRWEKFVEDTAAVVSVITAAFTGGLLVATYYLWSATRDLVRGADKTARHQLRAYVTVPHVTINNEHQPEGVVEILVLVAIRNFGQTPATNCSYWLDICSRERPLSAQLTRPETSKDSGIGVIAPGDTFTIKTEIPLLADGGEVHSGRHAMYAYGQFHYTDVFNERQTSNFRFMRSGESWSADGEMEVCTEGNDAT